MPSKVNSFTKKPSESDDDLSSVTDINYGNIVSDDDLLSVTDNVAKNDECKFKPQLDEIYDQLKTANNVIKSLVAQCKKLEVAYKHDVKRASTRKHKRNGEYKATGFAKPVAVPTQLANFLGVESGSLLTGPKITSLVWNQLRERKLVCPDDKRVFRTNADVTKVFGVPASVNACKDHDDKNGFNIQTLQTYVSKALGRSKNKTNVVIDDEKPVKIVKSSKKMPKSK